MGIILQGYIMVFLKSSLTLLGYIMAFISDVNEKANIIHLTAWCPHKPEKLQDFHCSADF
jgi:hypothetical protein